MKIPLWVKALVVPLAIVLDQWMKNWTIENIMPLGYGSRPLIPGVVQMIYVENRGAAFGLLQNARWLFIAATVIAIAFAVVAYAKGWIYGEFGQWAVMLVVAGALGNLIDRVRQGYVVDMFEFLFVNFAIFNVADMFVTTGGVLVCIYLVFIHEKLSKSAAGA